MCEPLSRRFSSPGILLFGPVAGDGLRAVDLPRESPRPRSVPPVHERQALPCGLPGKSGAHQLGRCQRGTRLAHLCRLRAGAGRNRATALCVRSDWRRDRSEFVRTGLNHHRPVPGAVPLARFRKHKAAVKMHTLLDLHGNIPTFISITAGKVHDVNVLDEILPEAGELYVMDRGYLDFERLFGFTACGAFFVVRTKSNVILQRRYSRVVDKSTGVRSDHTVILTALSSAMAYPDTLRRISYLDVETGHRFKFLTNNFLLPALTIAKIYKARWQVELFFKWIKQHLRIKAFYGTSENAVETQIWIAVSIYVLVAIVRKRLGLAATLYQTLQILSVTLFEKTPILCALQAPDADAEFAENVNQLILFDI